MLQLGQPVLVQGDGSEVEVSSFQAALHLAKLIENRGGGGEGWRRGGVRRGGRRKERGRRMSEEK